MIVINPASPIPPFEQLRTQLIEAISSGELATGERLPPVRRLAEELELSPGTVARAYRELEAARYIETRGRHGTFVLGRGNSRAQQLDAVATAFIEHSRALGLDPAVALEHVRRTLAR